jgi:hypothetical protein
MTRDLGGEMNRRDALLAILLTPSGYSSLLVQEKRDQNNNKVAVLSPGTRLRMDLADMDDAAVHGGVFELQIGYKGETKVFSAKEIWEALEAK